MKNYVPEAFNGLTYVVAVAQTNEVFQWIELGFSILTSVVLIAYRLWKWYKSAKADGKITKDELKEGIKIVINDEDKKEGEKK